MVPIRFDPAGLTGEKKAFWDRWSADAREETTKLIKKWEATGRITTDDFNSQIWSELKHWLLENVCAGKCAYCETHIEQARQPGHAEHFRPKAGIRNRGRTRSRGIDGAGNVVEHPGYFWLAYSWKNLLPCCQLCNTGRGKNNQFPIERDHVLCAILDASQVAKLKAIADSTPSLTWPRANYLGPEDLDDIEGRVLLHPYYDDPTEHLIFGDRGIEAARQINGVPSAKGLASIEVFDLKNSALRAVRAAAQLAALNAMNAAFADAVNNKRLGIDEARQYARDVLDGMLKSNPPYAAAIEYTRKAYK